jgi:hypothetical protein
MNDNERQEQRTTMAMNKDIETWRVIINPKIWNMGEFVLKYSMEQDASKKIINQSKGKARMVKCPKSGDNVWYVIKGKIVMKGVVVSDGFISGEAHKNDLFNMGDIREHSEVMEYAAVFINEVGLSEPIRNTGQRTWVKM